MTEETAERLVLLSAVLLTKAQAAAVGGAQKLLSDLRTKPALLQMSLVVEPVKRPDLDSQPKSVRKRSAEIVQRRGLSVLEESE